jgi:O-antigen ligase
LPLKIAATSLSLAALVIGLAIPAVMPEIANIDYFIIAGLAVVLFSLSAPWRRLLASPAVFMPLFAGVLLTICFIINADAPLDALAAVFFIPLFLVAPMAELFRRSGSLVTPASISLAATAGTFAALCLALFESFVLGIGRAGITVNNPIHFADIALTLGFIGLVGVYSERSLVRVLAVCAPLFGLIAVVLSGSRGPLVSAVPMAGAALVVLLAHFGARERRLTNLLLATVVCLQLVMLAHSFGLFAHLRAFESVANVLLGQDVDSSTALRLVMYQSAWNAFLAAPVFGHGLIGFIETTAQFVPAGATFPTFEHLHSDPADFAVIGGTIGLIAYGGFILAPVVDALTAPAGKARNAALYLAITLSVGYLAMGLTNAMFGVLTQTVLYGFCLAIVSHLARAGNTEPAQ